MVPSRIAKYLKNRDLQRVPINWARLEAEQALVDLKLETVPDWVREKVKIENEDVHWVALDELKLSFPIWVEKR